MAADVVLAADDLRLWRPEASLGVCVTGGLVARRPAAIGPMRAEALMPLGETVEADRAEAWGLVHRVVPPAALDAQSLAACRRLAELAPPVAATFKRVVNRIGLARFDEAITLESEVRRAWRAGGE